MGQSKAMISLSELPSLLDDRQPSDVCIGVPSSQGNLLRVLLRQRLTMLTAVDRAGELAEQLAGAHDETVLSRDLQPSAVHVVATSDGCQVWLDYDLGLRTHRHPKVVRRTVAARSRASKPSCRPWTSIATSSQPKRPGPSVVSPPTAVLTPLLDCNFQYMFNCSQ